MGINNFNWNGKAVTVQIDKVSGHTFYYEENGNIRECFLKDFQANYRHSTISVNWVNHIKNIVGESLNSTSKNYVDTDSTKFDNYYSVTELPEQAGNYYAKLCINGIMSREIGCTCFNLMGEFVDPNTL